MSNQAIRGTSVLFTLVLSACALASAMTHAQAGALKRTVVVDDLKSPWSIAFISETDALITEKEGGLVRADLATGAVKQVSGLPDDLVNDIRSETPADNGGLFDVVLHPDFEDNGLIYLSYAAGNEQGRTTKVVRGKLTGDRLTAFQTIFVADPFTEDEYFHYGGGMVFGADKKLYLTVGERLYNEADQPALPIAQDLADKRGKIYRLNDDGTAPADNPDFGPDAPAGLYAAGIRAAQGITLHPETGAIWFSEHGTHQGDEINRLEPGANYGWPIKTTGGYRDPDYTPPDMPDRTFTPPVWAWLQTVAPTGLAFYTGDEHPEWRGDLFVAGLSRGSLWRFNFEDGEIASVEELFVGERIRSRTVAVSPEGRLYILTDTLFTSRPEGGLAFSGAPGGQVMVVEEITR